MAQNTKKTITNKLTIIDKEYVRIHAHYSFENSGYFNFKILH